MASLLLLSVQGVFLHMGLFRVFFLFIFYFYFCSRILVLGDNFISLLKQLSDELNLATSIAEELMS